MTLQPYGPNKLDQLSLRLLDLAGVLREMAHNSREHGIEDLALHDKKALEWCANLDDWAHKARAELDIKVHHTRSRRRASSSGEQVVGE